MYRKKGKKVDIKFYKYRSKCEKIVTKVCEPFAKEGAVFFLDY